MSDRMVLVNAANKFPVWSTRTLKAGTEARVDEREAKGKQGRFAVRQIKKIIITIFILTTPIIYADNQSSLNSLNQSIASIRTDLKKSTIQKSHLENALAEIETSEGKIHAQLQNTTHALTQHQQKLVALKQATIPLINQKNQNNTLLIQQIRAAYILNRQPYLALLLTPNGMSDSHHLLMYYHYIAAEQMQTMTHLQQSIAQYQENQNQIQHQYTQLLSLKQAQINNQLSLQKTKSQREQLMVTINQDIKTKNQKLTQLLANKKQLQQTVESLRTKMSEHLSRAVLGNAPFSHLQGKLTWPLQGRVLRNFGTQIEQSELRWDGTVIGAKPGQAVNAVASGRVIFARWLAGYGLLIIINHGGGYMTLYGRNQQIAVNVGDYVKPGETIATAGKSGGFDHTALYFSIRHNTTALNPSTWCR